MSRVVVGRDRARKRMRIGGISTPDAHPLNYWADEPADTSDLHDYETAPEMAEFPKALVLPPPRWQGAPTPNEVRAHAVGHPIALHPCEGFWLGRQEDPWDRILVMMGVVNGGVTIRADDSAAIDWRGYRWCPCTADGVALREGEL